MTYPSSSIHQGRERIQRDSFITMEENKRINQHTKTHSSGRCNTWRQTGARVKWQWASSAIQLNLVVEMAAAVVVVVVEYPTHPLVIGNEVALLADLRIERMKRIKMLLLFSTISGYFSLDNGADAKQQTNKRNKWLLLDKGGKTHRKTKASHINTFWGNSKNANWKIEETHQPYEHSHLVMADFHLVIDDKTRCISHSFHAPNRATV